MAALRRVLSNEFVSYNKYPAFKAELQAHICTKVLVKQKEYTTVYTPSE